MIAVFPEFRPIHPRSSLSKTAQPTSPSTTGNLNQGPTNCCEPRCRSASGTREGATGARDGATRILTGSTEAGKHLMCPPHPTKCSPANSQGDPRPPRTHLPTPPQTQIIGPGTELPIARRPYEEPPVRHNPGRMDKICVECGALHWLLERTTAPGSSNSRPLFSMCCGNGNVRLPAIAPPPD